MLGQLLVEESAFARCHLIGPVGCHISFPTLATAFVVGKELASISLYTLVQYST